MINYSPSRKYIISARGVRGDLEEKIKAFQGMFQSQEKPLVGAGSHACTYGALDSLHFHLYNILEDFDS